MKRFLLPYTALPTLTQYSKRLTDNYINSNTGVAIQSALATVHDEHSFSGQQSTALPTAKRKEMLMNVLLLTE